MRKTIVLSIAAGIILLANPLAAQSQGWNVEMVGSVYSFFGCTDDVAVQGDYAYVAAGRAGLHILDISDPANLFEAGYYPINADIEVVAVSGDYAYLVGYDSLWVINIFDPSNPFQVGVCETVLFQNDLVIEDGYAYIASGSAYSELLITDISDPTNPNVIGQYDISGYDDAEGISVSDGYAYIILEDGCLPVINISNPANPYQVGETTVAGEGYKITASGGYAYAACGESGFCVVNISNPLNPFTIATYVTAGSVRDVAVSGDYAYLADWDCGLRIMNISNPIAPYTIGWYDTEGHSNSVAISGSYVYLSDGEECIRVIDVSHPSNPHEIGFFVNPGDLCDGALLGDYAYLADNEFGLRVVDISDSTNPFEVGNFYIGHTWPMSVALSGDYAYLAAGSYGLRIIDISDPANPIEVGFYDPNVSMPAVDVAGNYAYISDGTSIYNVGLGVIDVSNPASPYQAGFLEVGDVYGVAVEGDYAYTVEFGQLYIIDISDPTAPYQAGHCYYPQSTGTIPKIVISGNFAYISDDAYGLRIINIIDPANPYEIGYFDPQVWWQALNVAVSGDFVYVTWGSYGFSVLNVSNPANPIEVGYYDPPGSADGIMALGDLCYVADECFFHIFDCSEAVAPPESLSVSLTPIHPPIVIPENGGSFDFNIEVVNNAVATQFFDFWAQIELPGYVSIETIYASNLTLSAGDSVSRNRTQLVPANAPAGVYTYCAFVGDYPWEIFTFDLFNFMKEGTDGGDFLWTVDYWQCTGELFPGETIIASNTPEAFTLLAPYPNPFNAEMTVEFEVPRATEVELSLFDVQGRLVDVIASGQYSPGFHRAHWNGEEFSSGVYFLRMQAGDFADCRKVMLVK